MKRENKKEYYTPVLVCQVLKVCYTKLVCVGAGVGEGVSVVACELYVYKHIFFA